MVLRNAALPDTQRVLTLFSLEQEYYMNDNATAQRIARQALAMARRQGFVRGELMVLSDLSRAASAAQDLPQAERWAQELERRVRTAPLSLQRFRIVALQTLASVAVGQGNNERALAYLRQAMALLPLVANRPSSDFPLLTYYGLSTVYTDQVFTSPNPPDSLVRQARYYTARFASLARSQRRPDMLAEAYTAQGRLADVAGVDSAAFYLGQAVRLHQQLDARLMEGYTRTVWAGLELRHGRALAAIAQARQALVLTRAVHDPSTEIDARDVLAQALAATGQPVEAYAQAQRARTLHDSTERVKNRTVLQTLQVSFDTHRKESQIRGLTQQREFQQVLVRQQRQRLWALEGLLVVVVLGAVGISGLAWRLRRSRQLLAVQNEELTTTRAAQDRLYALVAHDLRSPVVAFAGLADLLNRYVQRQDTARLAGLGGRIRQATHNLSELLDNLLNWAISQRGGLTPHPEPLSVAQLLAEVATLYQPTADAVDVTLNVEVPSDLVVQADSDMTRTILRNLVGNALKATLNGGQVRLYAYAQDGGICIEVADTGPGLTPAVLAQLGQHEGLRVAGEGRGAGLGLLLSRNFAQAQGGTLVIANAPMNAGTIATLMLPTTNQIPNEG